MASRDYSTDQPIEELALSRQKLAELEDEAVKLRAELGEGRRIEAELRRELDMMHEMVEHAPNLAPYRIIFDHAAPPDRAQGVVYYAPALEELVGIDDASDPRSWFENMHPDDIEMVVEGHKKGFETHRFDETPRFFVPEKGEWRWVRFTSKAIPDEDGQAKFVNGYAYDVTEYKLAEQRLLAYQERLRSMTDRMQAAEERERKRIAGILHDQVGQSLFAAKWEMQRLASTCQTELGIDEDVLMILDSAIADTRSLTAELYPRELYEFGLEAALKRLVANHEKRFGVKGEFAAEGDIEEFDEKSGVVLYRAVSELMTNVAKHARASKVIVRLQVKDDVLKLSVIDDGVGFSEDAETAGDAGGYGLFSIKERMRGIGGELIIDSQLDFGTQVTLVAPISESFPLS